MNFKKLQTVLLATALFILVGCAGPVLRGTGDLGVVIERASGSVQIVDTSKRVALATVKGLGDLSHASLVYSRDGRYAIFASDFGAAHCSGNNLGRGEAYLLNMP